MLCIAAVMRRECPLWGYQRTFREVRPMSALPPKADMDHQGNDVGFVPKADSCTAAKKAKLLIECVQGDRAVPR
jgi:hypothetical protein